MPARVYLLWFLGGVLVGWTLLSLFWCWVLERRDRVVHARDQHYRRLVSEQDAALRGLYQQTSRLAQLVVHHAPAPEAPHRACRIAWPRQES